MWTHVHVWVARASWWAGVRPVIYFILADVEEHGHGDKPRSKIQEEGLPTTDIRQFDRDPVISRTNHYLAWRFVRG